MATRPAPAKKAPLARKPAAKTVTARKSPPGVTLDDVREVAGELPNTTEGPSYGTPGFRVRDKLFARMFDDETLVLKVDPAFRWARIAASPDVFYVTPHYEGYPWVLVRLRAIGKAQLRELLGEARELAVPPKRPAKKSRSTRG